MHIKFTHNAKLNKCKELGQRFLQKNKLIIAVLFVMLVFNINLNILQHIFTKSAKFSVWKISN